MSLLTCMKDVQTPAGFFFPACLAVDLTRFKYIDLQSTDNQDHQKPSALHVFPFKSIKKIF